MTVRSVWDSHHGGQGRDDRWMPVFPIVFPIFIATGLRRDMDGHGSPCLFVGKWWALRTSKPIHVQAGNTLHKWFITNCAQPCHCVPMLMPQPVNRTRLVIEGFVPCMPPYSAGHSAQFQPPCNQPLQATHKKPSTAPSVPLGHPRLVHLRHRLPRPAAAELRRAAAAVGAGAAPGTQLLLALQATRLVAWRQRGDLAEQL